MLRYYLSLRVKQFTRFFSFNDVNPVLGIVILFALFVFVSLLLFDKVHYASWIYTAITLTAISELQDGKMNAYLKQHVDVKTLFSIKLCENLLYVIPFILVLMYKTALLQAVIIIVFTIFYSRYNIKIAKPKLKALHTPYKPYSFELNYAFRLFFPVYIIYLLLLPVSILADNVYLLIVPYFMLLFFVQSCYGVVEEPFYIWIHRCTASQFLIDKIKQVLVNTTINAAPFLIVGLAFFHQQLALLLFCFFFSCLAGIGSMLMKYHFYPSAFIIQVSQMLLFGFTLACIISPASIIIVILFLTYSFIKARNTLKTYLHA